MYSSKVFRGQMLLVIVLMFCSVCPNLNAGNIYLQTNLVSDVPGVAATTDPNLKNPWGVSFSRTSPFWISDQATGLATLYTGAGNILSLVVTIPETSIPSGPTGQVFNGTTSFNLPDGSPARFLFDTLGGNLFGWNGGAGTIAVSVGSVSGAVFTGLALANAGGSNYLYAADNTGHIDVFDTNFNNVTGTTFAGKFVDPSALPGFNPFNIQNINGNLYVTYANVIGGVGQPGGFVDEFDSSGNLLKRIATSGALNAPWGITLAPSGFGVFGGDLLIGQFGDGQILVYDPATDAFVAPIDGKNGMPIVNPFLWSLDFRTAGPALPLALYFTAGYNNQADGLFGEITTVPEPSSITLLFLAAGSLGARQLRRALHRNA